MDTSILLRLIRRRHPSKMMTAGELERLIVDYEREKASADERRVQQTNQLFNETVHDVFS